ncbi:uncharacterized protein LOC126767945 [Bactrocera neohumeralis]|uniref:uncharacterized protein LOC126767945 n=1 Tax=Bactrocera neohumeralis TaxID=98809 RepID=UPI002165AFC1|nr:uncharacterized protein LOC126767945 [Bactrocera neohumeralis]
MNCTESYNANHLNNNHNIGFDREEDIYDDNEAEGHSNDDENTNSELFIRLTDMVRKHYCNYLEKQLIENIHAWRANITEKYDAVSNSELPIEKAALQECCRMLEDRALKSCMHARRYQRTMLKIIAEVRRNTQENRLEGKLTKFIDANEDSWLLCSRKAKATQTDESMFLFDYDPKSSTTEAPNNICSTPSGLSLEQKIEMFQNRLNQETVAKVAATHKMCRPKTSRRTPLKLSKNHRSTQSSYNKISLDISGREQNQKSLGEGSKLKLTRDNSKMTHDTSPTKLKEVTEMSICSITNNCTPTMQLNADSIGLEQDDEIAKELDQLFSEEKSELEELLGLNSNSEVDDPQVRSVLEEIKSATLGHDLKQNSNEHQQTINSPSDNEASPINVDSSPQQHVSLPCHTERPVSNMRHSLWPCELYMQRRRLSESLSRLLEEDFRWHDLIKWKFQKIFGDDSDDEFATCSPSIELNEVLICSCIRRISPWMVKHLMKPMRAGLISNRFLFKKLAKRLAHSIVLENQYPDERFIKHAVEEYFCLHQAVVNMEDLATMPSLNTINNNLSY